MHSVTCQHILGIGGVLLHLPGYDGILGKPFLTDLTPQIDRTSNTVTVPFDLHGKDLPSPPAQIQHITAQNLPSSYTIAQTWKIFASTSQKSTTHLPRHPRLLPPNLIRLPCLPRLQPPPLIPLLLPPSSPQKASSPPTQLFQIAWDMHGQRHKWLVGARSRRLSLPGGSVLLLLQSALTPVGAPPVGALLQSALAPFGIPPVGAAPTVGAPPRALRHHRRIRRHWLA